MKYLYIYINQSFIIIVILFYLKLKKKGLKANYISKNIKLVDNSIITKVAHIITIKYK